MENKVSISLNEIDENNFSEVLKLELNAKQEKFVAPNVKSLAECYLYRNDGVRPFAIVRGVLVVGFALLDIDDEAEDVTIWRIMIDKKYQNKGFGKEAIKCLILWIEEHTEYRSVFIDYVYGNDAAKHLYEQLGFKNERINEYGEQVMKIQI